MVSIKTIYSRAFAVLRKKPFLLWGISLLAMLLSALSVPLLGVIPAASIAVSMLLQTAMTLIYLRGYRGEEIAVTQLFDTFKDWKTVKRVLCGMGWASLWIFLWSLIPVVGIVFGIIRTYEYRLTPYILMHEPDVPITEAIKVLNDAGAKKVIVVATHGILSDPATKRLSESGAAEVVFTDTLPIPAEKRFEQLTVLSIAPLLARAIQEVFEDGSVTSLFN